MRIAHCCTCLLMEERRRRWFSSSIMGSLSGGALMVLGRRCAHVQRKSCSHRAALFYSFLLFCLVWVFLSADVPSSQSFGLHSHLLWHASSQVLSQLKNFEISPEPTREFEMYPFRYVDEISERDLVCLYRNGILRHAWEQASVRLLLLATDAASFYRLVSAGWVVSCLPPTFRWSALQNRVERCGLIRRPGEFFLENHSLELKLALSHALAQSMKLIVFENRIDEVCPLSAGGRGTRGSRAPRLPP